MDLIIEIMKEIIKGKFGHNLNLKFLATGILSLGVEKAFRGEYDQLKQLSTILETSEKLKDEEWEAILEPMYKNITSHRE